MNLKLNAKQKKEIEQCLLKAKFTVSEFSYVTQKSECVFVFVRHAYSMLDGDEPTIAEAITYKGNVEYFFTFERDQKGKFFATSFPELDVGRSIMADNWDCLLIGFGEWLDILKIQIDEDGCRPSISTTFIDMVHNRDYLQVKNEFLRAERNCNFDPAAAIAAASSMVEAACKLFISDHRLTLPTKQTIKPLWNIVSEHLLPKASCNKDNDIQRLITGLASVVDGLGSLRTHAGSAHGRDRNEQQAETAEAYLAIHSSQAIVLFMMQKW